MCRGCEEQNVAVIDVCMENVWEFFILSAFEMNVFVYAKITTRKSFIVWHANQCLPPINIVNPFKYPWHFHFEQ